ncbi:hypothetical protein vseg_015112 [Gypsophila vaccaria]
MGHLESTLEWLRPLIVGSHNNTWDYCVVWKLGDDPSRFIEWVGCCCNGGVKQDVGKKRKKRETNVSISECKDANSVHPASTKSCEALARLPPYMSLYSGVHGEVVMSSQPRWINVAHTADSKTSTEELQETRVLIPVFGGLVELFSTDFISEDDSIIQFVQSQYNSSETETMSNSTITFDDGPYLNPLLEKTLDSCLSSLANVHISPTTQTLISINQTLGESTTTGGSSTGSFPSVERPSPDSTPRSVSQVMPFTVKKGDNGSQKAGKKHYTSKNLYTERNRRKRNGDGLLTLRSVVPKITKMNKGATLSDAVDYIMELQNEQRYLLDELENFDKKTYDLEPTGLMTSNKERFPSSLAKSLISQAQVEVNQLGVGNYLLRVMSQQSPGVFTELLEALESLDVVAVDVSATICNGSMSSYIIVQTNNKEVKEKDLRDCLSA